MDPDLTPPTAADANVLQPGCDRCPALVDSRTCIAWGNGPLDADVMVVGEAPGAGDPAADRWRGGNHSGLAYTSRHSGRRIRSLFVDLGYEGQVYYTNAVKCFPSDGDGSNRQPTDEELANCRTHLETELDQVDPTVVVPTGKHATQTLLAFEGQDLDGFLDVVLDLIECPSLDVCLLPILHPSYQEVWLSRLGYSPEEYRAELQRALSAVR